MKSSLQHNVPTNHFMLFNLLCHAYELTVKMPRAMASIGFYFFVYHAFVHRLG